MHPIPPLAAMGRRIVINGPSNAGKSTLADALARKLSIPVIHLDRLSHEDRGVWVPRDKAEFHVLHDAALAADEWVMDGNYTELMPQRLARATSIVVIDDHVLRRYLRYFNRTLFQRQRIGGLLNGQDALSWEMIGWIWKSRKSAAKYRRLAMGSGLPHVFVADAAELHALYSAWHLQPPG